MQTGSPHPESRIELAHHLCAVPWIDLQVDADATAALAEVRALDTRFVGEPQREETAPVPAWASLALWVPGGISGKGTYEDDTGPGAAPRAWTDHAAACPSLVERLSSVLDLRTCDTIHVLRLAPGGIVHPHSDAPERALSFSVSFALNMPAGCTFRIDCDAASVAAGFERVVPFRPGSALAMNVARVHRVDNESSETRYHVIARTPMLDGLGRWTRDALRDLARAQNGWNSLDAVRGALDAATRAGRMPLPAPIA